MTMTEIIGRRIEIGADHEAEIATTGGIGIKMQISGEWTGIAEEIGIWIEEAAIGQLGVSEVMRRGIRMGIEVMAAVAE